MRSATVRLSHRATARCFSSRPARGIWPYATSRIIACQNVYSVCPSRFDVRFGADQLAAEDVGQPVVDRRLVAAAKRRQRPRPEHLADHRRILQERLVLVGQLIEPRADQQLQ